MAECSKCMGNWHDCVSDDMHVVYHVFPLLRISQFLHGCRFQGTYYTNIQQKITTRILLYSSRKTYGTPLVHYRLYNVLYDCTSRDTQSLLFECLLIIECFRSHSHMTQPHGLITDHTIQRYVIRMHSSQWLLISWLLLVNIETSLWHYTLVITQSLLFECLLNVFGHTVTGHSVTLITRYSSH